MFAKSLSVSRLPMTVILSDMRVISAQRWYTDTGNCLLPPRAHKHQEALPAAAPSSALRRWASWDQRSEASFPGSRLPAPGSLGITWVSDHTPADTELFTTTNLWIIISRFWTEWSRERWTKWIRVRQDGVRRGWAGGGCRASHKTTREASSRINGFLLSHLFHEVEFLC